MLIDTSFDFRTDAGGRDPDRYSLGLRRYHRLLWSKPLPSGALFELDDTTPGWYLHHCSDVGEFFLSSDSIMPTFTRYVILKHITGQCPEEENEAFRTTGYTIGSYIVFPQNQVDRKPTINGARGFDPRIRDRMDLTLECIRLHHLGHNSPLGATLGRYGRFFALFEDFRGYVDHFLLQDLVTDDYSAIKFLMPFEHFCRPALPKDLEAYKAYRSLTTAFVEARNRRIDRLVPDCSEVSHGATP